MIDENLKTLVKEEAGKLKEHATKLELSRLNLQRICATMSQRCVYGQMTGNYWSSRALDLLRKCAKPYSDDIVGKVPKNIDSEFNVINRSPNDSIEPEATYFSPIEFYIAQDDAKVSLLIDYLQGKTETLDI